MQSWEMTLSGKTPTSSELYVWFREHICAKQTTFRVSVSLITCHARDVSSAARLQAD